MEETSKKNECRHCHRFKRYYTKGAYKLSATEIGQCYLKNEIVGLHDTCEDWRRKETWRNISNKRVCRNLLPDLLLEISTIRATLEND